MQRREQNFVLDKWGKLLESSACLVRCTDHNIHIHQWHMVSMYGQPQNIEGRYEYGTI